MRASAGDVLVCNRDAGGAACARTSVQAFLMCGKPTRCSSTELNLGALTARLAHGVSVT